MGKFLHKGNNFTGKLCVGKCRFESKKRTENKPCLSYQQF